MGVSFKVSKTGKRFRPKPTLVQEETGLSGESSRVLVRTGSKREVDIPEAVNGVDHLLPEHEVSFTLNLFPKGYSIGKPTEVENGQTLLQDVKSLHPYDRASESLFSAIESGWLPGDILDDIPSKYFDGAIVCEVRDYRNCTSEQGTVISASNVVPILHKVRLRMSLENVVKDMPLIADDSWTYSDLMEVEARILKVIQPRLCLDPTPMLDRLCKDSSASKLNLGIGKRRRLQQVSEVTITNSIENSEKNTCIDRIPMNANCVAGGPGTQITNASLQQVYENIPMQHGSSGIPSFRPNTYGQEVIRAALPLPSQSKLQPAINSATVAQDHASGLPGSFSGVNAKMSSSQNMMSSYTDTIGSNSPVSMKRENPDAQLTSMAAAMKRQKQTPIGLDGIQQQQQTGPQLVGLAGTDMQWKNQLLQSQLDIKGIQYSSTLAGQRYPSSAINNVPNREQGTSFYFNQQGMRFGAKEEQTDRQELERSKDALDSDNSALDLQQSRAHLLQHSSMRNHPPTAVQWTNARPVPEKDMGKDDALQRRKSVPSPRVSSGPMVQSPVSSRSGEISSGSVGGQFGGVATASAMGVQKDKLAANTNAAIGAPSVTSSPSDSVRQHQTSGTGKRKQNSKTPAVSAVGSPASVNNVNFPLIANSPSIGTAPVGDQVILERFAKIDAVAQRYQLNIKKNTVDEYPAREPVQYSTQQLAFYLSDSFNCEDFTDQIKPMSKSLIGGTINTYKARTMNFLRSERLYQVPMRLTMTEKPFDGTVSMQYGCVDDSDSHDYHLTLSTTHHADLLAAQFAILMDRDGYQKTDDQIRPVPIRMVAPPSNLAPVSGIMSDGTASEMKQAELATGQPLQVAAPAVANGVGPINSSQNPSTNPRMLTSANNSQALAISQGYIPGAAMPARIQQVDQSLLQQQQQQQQLQQNTQSQLQQQQQLSVSHVQRSSPLLTTNPISQIMGQASNLQMNTNQMVNSKPTPLQLQMLQQQAQQQQQQQPQLARKVMMGLNPNISMGHSVMSIGGLSNVIGMGGVRGISSPMGPISGLGNISPHQMNLASASNFSPGPRSSSLSPAQAAAAAMATKLRMAQSRGLYGQSGITGMAGNTNQMHPGSPGLSMLGALNRANMSQRGGMSPMGPPKIPGTNFYLNPQQQQHLQQHLQQQQLQQQQQQQQQQQMQQQISSPLQQPQVGSPPMVGSPTAMVMQHQQISPQQIGQQTAMSPQQLSSGALQHMNNSGNPAAAPASPQLSSQTHGSVGSITSSPMEQLQGANKAASAGNV
ncbi:protein PHYTOCHROME-DEPENDENT LATE-FLOWERING [Musa acuminata AAA Group]|uniref:protein PHYTOCHROME-DEPENDENT LATE-FLOWERING n=1 Tax=Musa acuminata AAA Group TaxID=214697 RepID=UPI0031DD0A86